MKLLDLVPVTTPGLITPEMEDYINKYLSADTQMDVVQITEGTASIECEYDEAMCAPDIIAKCIEAEKQGYEGVFINCFGDPGVRAARECVNIPVFGGFEPVMLLAMGMADRVAIVTVLPNVLPLIRGGIAKAHLGDRVACVRSVDIPVLELSSHEKLCNAVYEESLKAIREDGAEAIVLGCTAMVDVTETVQARLHEAGYCVPVLEAAQSAVMMLELTAKMGLRQSRITYMPVPQK
ncbi:aspartate/glutamate racemase family protein [Bacilliculturomica massiliensis]|uniref:aspartate/glutamate racemase family protein n=1 Tax=Bacilliculturomica massiliensis TaxID=1917867 RepID=UPI001030ED7E|nr:aspartate/glutamate racemase family protein [Bacilliculturomica massiliensis]